MGKEIEVIVPTPKGMQKKKGHIVNVKSSKENWSEYELENGSTLRLKQVVVQVVLLDEKDDSGKPVYQISANPIIVVE